MADFAAVLKKTIDAQADQSPEMRQRVYAKARSTIEQKLLAANASEAVSSRQREMLESAIAQVEDSYAPVMVVADEPESIVDPLQAYLETEDHAPVAPRPEPAVPDFIARDDRAPRFNADQLLAGDRHDDVLSAERGDEWQRGSERESNLGRNERYDDIDDRGVGPKRSYKGLIAGLVAVLVLGGAGYAVWANKDKLQELASSLGRSDTPAEVPGNTVPTKPDEEKAPEAATGTGNNTVQPVEGDNQQPPAEPKLTLRLMPDGSEVDAGRAGDAPGVGEGQSTTASTPGEAQPAQSGGNPQTPAPAQANAAVAVGQQALFYEERSGQETSSVEKGTVVWSVIQDSPGDGAPAEPAIRADVTVPDGKINLRMTIRRNADKTLPASHLVEMIFTVPDGFPGGAIDNVQRVAFKETEQATGNPLVAVPTKIADNFFIIALNDARTAVDTNLSLMRRQQWIDIPFTYRNGRRALLSLEKGIPGDKVFEEVLKSWGSAGG